MRTRNWRKGSDSKCRLLQVCPRAFPHTSGRRPAIRFPRPTSLLEATRFSAPAQTQRIRRPFWLFHVEQQRSLRGEGRTPGTSDDKAEANRAASPPRRFSRSPTFDSYSTSRVIAHTHFRHSRPSRARRTARNSPWQHCFAHQDQNFRKCCYNS